MKDEVFVFLGEPYKGKAYRKLPENGIKQYCKIDEIITFITDSINNNTLKMGNKYNITDSIKFKYKFIEGSNKKSVSVIIKTNELSLYLEELNKLERLLGNPGLIKNFNISKVISLLDKSLVLMTYTNSVDCIKK